MTSQQLSKAIRQKMLKDAGWRNLRSMRRDEWYIPRLHQRMRVDSNGVTHLSSPTRMCSFGAAWASYCETTGRSRRLSKAELECYAADDSED